MIISETGQYAFVHIPKCAGSTLRDAVMPLWPDNISYWGIRTHEALGPVDVAHMPLDLMARAYPDELAQLQSSDCYAVIRDPLDRFKSAFSEHLKNFQGTNYALISQENAQTALDRAIEHLRGGDLNSPEFVHFAPQVDYVFLNGTQVVKHLYPLAQSRQLVLDISARLGVDPPEEVNRNERRHLRYPALAGALESLNGISRAVLPEGARRSLAKLAKSTLTTTKKHTAPADAVLNSDQVRSFVDSFYAADHDLYRTVSHPLGEKEKGTA